MKTLENAKYTGYLWYSDEQKPRVYEDAEMELTLNECHNPFIVEGYLTDGIKSYSIKFVSGKYIVGEHTLADFKDVVCDEVVVYTHRMKNVAKMKFHQYWRPVVDELCENMPVLQPAELVFVEFVK